MLARLTIVQNTPGLGIKVWGLGLDSGLGIRVGSGYGD